MHLYENQSEIQAHSAYLGDMSFNCDAVIFLLKFMIYIIPIYDFDVKIFINQSESHNLDTEGSLCISATVMEDLGIGDREHALAVNQVIKTNNSERGIGHGVSIMQLINICDCLAVFSVVVLDVAVHLFFIPFMFLNYACIISKMFQFVNRES